MKFFSWFNQKNQYTKSIKTKPSKKNFELEEYISENINNAINFKNNLFIDGKKLTQVYNDCTNQYNSIIDQATQEDILKYKLSGYYENLTRNKVLVMASQIENLYTDVNQLFDYKPVDTNNIDIDHASEYILKSLEIKNGEIFNSEEETISFFKNNIKEIIESKNKENRKKIEKYRKQIKSKIELSNFRPEYRKFIKNILLYPAAFFELFFKDDELKFNNINFDDIFFLENNKISSLDFIAIKFKLSEKEMELLLDDKTYITKNINEVLDDLDNKDLICYRVYINIKNSKLKEYKNYILEYYPDFNFDKNYSSVLIIILNDKICKIIIDKDFNNNFPVYSASYSESIDDGIFGKAIAQLGDKQEKLINITLRSMIKNLEKIAIPLAEVNVAELALDFGEDVGSDDKEFINLALSSGFILTRKLATTGGSNVVQYHNTPNHIQTYQILANQIRKDHDRAVLVPAAFSGESQGGVAFRSRAGMEFLKSNANQVLIYILNNIYSNVFIDLANLLMKKVAKKDNIRYTIISFSDILEKSITKQTNIEDLQLENKLSEMGIIESDSVVKKATDIARNIGVEEDYIRNSKNGKINDNNTSEYNPGNTSQS